MTTYKTRPEETLILIVDIQEKLAPAMPAARLADVVRASGILLEAAAIFGAPVLFTEQYPAGLGKTLEALSTRLAALSAPRFEKVSFSACGDVPFAEHLATLSVKNAIVVGMEAHVCVLQTARDLSARGLQVLIPIDGVASRRDDHREVGLDLAKAAGATVTTTETIAFDWLGRAGSDAFRRLSKLIR